MKHSRRSCHTPANRRSSGATWIFAATVFVLAAIVSNVSAGTFPARIAKSEQDSITFALLKSRLFNQPNGDFDYYLDIRGQYPSPELLAQLGNPRFKPYSLADAAQGDSKRNRIGSGHNVMRIIIGGFVMTAENTAKGDVDESCGTGTLCGSHFTVVMLKVNGTWSVNATENMIAR